MSPVKVHLNPHLECGSVRKQTKIQSENYRDHRCRIKVQRSYRRAVREGFHARRMAVSDRGRPFLRETAPWRETTGSYFCSFAH